MWDVIDGWCSDNNIYYFVSARNRTAPDGTKKRTAAGSVIVVAARLGRPYLPFH
jgi:hypothetical protein